MSTTVSEPRSGSMLELARRQLAERVVPEAAKVLPAHISPQRFERVVWTAIAANPDLLAADRASLWTACVKAAQDGLLPDGREGALVTFYDRRRGRLMAQWMPMITGIVKKALNSRCVASITCNVVYEGEPFEVVLGDDERIMHQRDMDAPGKRRPVAVYAIATLRDPELGQVLTEGNGRPVRVREVMTWDQVEDVRAVSRAPDKGPWAQWTEEMARKTVIRRLLKRLPVGDVPEDETFRRVIERVDEQYEFGAQKHGEPPPDEPEDDGEAEPLIPADEQEEGPPIPPPDEGGPLPPDDPPPPEAGPAPRYVIRSRDGAEKEVPTVHQWEAEWRYRIASVERAKKPAKERRLTLMQMLAANNDVMRALNEAGAEDYVAAVMARVERASTALASLRPDDTSPVGG